MKLENQKQETIREMNKMNRTMKRISIRFVFLLLFIGILSSIFSQEIDSRKELLEFYETKLDYKQDVYDRTLQFIQENPDAPGIPTLYFNLAELSVEIDKEDISKTVDYYQKVLELDPDYPNKDVVLYNIGYFSFLEEVNKRDEARYKNMDKVINWPDELRLSEEQLTVPIEAYKELVNEFPESMYHTEAMYRLGTIYFEIAMDSRNPMQIYPQAIEYFDKVVEKENDPLYNFGLFQRGWTYFSSGQFDKAIEDFTKIVDIIEDDETKQAFFEADAIENIAFSLIEADGTDFVQKSVAAEKAKELLRDFVSEEYAKKVLLKAIDLKLTYSAPMQAIDLYNAYIDLYPLSIECPTYIDSIMTIYKQYPNRTRNNKDARELIVDERIRLVENYTPDSEWFLANQDKSIEAQMKVIREAYEFVETRYHNQFVENPNYENYLTYKSLVDNYVNFEVFTDEDALAKIQSMQKRIVDNSLHVATTLDDPSLYLTAIDYIHNYNNEYPEHVDEAEFKEDIFYCYEQIYEILEDSVVEEAYVDSVNQIEITEDDLAEMYISATMDYEELLNSESYTKPNKNDELIRIIYRRADIYYNREQYQEAFQNYQKLLSYELTEPVYKTAYTVLAEISEMNGDYKASEQYYRDAIQYADAEERKDYENNILATIRSGADTMMNSEDYQTAAEEYLRLAKELEATNEEQSISYIMQAIDVYKKVGEYDKAKDLFLDIASKKSDKKDVLAAFIGAWTISDSLQNWQQSEQLRNQFIARFPSSNEAYNLRLKIIDWYENEPFNDKAKAAGMYLALHDDSGSIDMGEDKKESLFIKAIQLYQDLGNEDKFIELTNRFANLYPNHDARQELLRNVAITHNQNKDIEAMLAFEKKYPDLPYSMELLKSVARYYNESGEDDKFEEIARYIYKKDPSVDLLTDIALEKIREKYDEIQTAFQDKNYAEMRTRISEFKALDKDYQNEGISLPLTSMYDRFDYFENYIDYYERLNSKITFVNNNIINASPNALVRVNDKTEWKRHLDGGAERIKNLKLTCDTAQEDLITLIREGSEFDIDKEQITSTLYLIAKTYDYAHEVLLSQIQLFLDVSTQLNSPVMNENPVQQRTFKQQIKGYGNQQALQLKQKAAQWYQTLLAQFYDEQDFSNEWTDLALERLIEWGVRAEKEYIPIYSSGTWKTNNEIVDDYDAATLQTTIWETPKILPNEKFFDEAVIFQLNPFTTYFAVEYDAEIRPEALIFDYIANGSINLIVNDMPIEIEPVIVDTINIQGMPIVHNKITVGRNLRQGINDILITIEPKSDQEEHLFATKITGQFGIEELEFHRTTEEHYLYSDFSWLSKKGSVSIDNLKLDESWKSAGESNLSFFKPQMFNMEDTEAISIWTPEIDTTRATTAYFVKEIDIPEDIHEANAKFIGEKVTTIWVNGKKEIDNYEIVYDTRLNKVDSKTLEITNLKKGKNVIVARVTGDVKYKGFIFEMHYITDRYEKVGMVEDDAANDSEIESSAVGREAIEEIYESETETLSQTEEPLPESEETDAVIMPENASFIEEEEEIKSYTITTDTSWFSTLIKPEVSIQEPLDAWVQATSSEIEVPNTLLDNFPEDAMLIRYPFSAEVENDVTSYFFKTISIYSDYLQGNLKIATNRDAKLYINGEMIRSIDADDEFVFLEENNLPLKSGNNVLLVELTDSDANNGFVCSLIYQVKE